MAHSVLFTASTFSHIARFHRPYLRAFSEKGFRVDLACGGDLADFPEASQIFSVPFEKRITSPRNITALRKLRRILAEGDYTLVACHTALAAFFTRLAAMYLPHRPKIAYVVHGLLFDGDTPFLKRSLLAAAERIASPATDLFLTMNAWDEAYLRERFPSVPLCSIPGMGVDFSAFAPRENTERRLLRAEYGFTEEQFLLVYAAEFSARKNQEMLLRTMTRLPESVGLLLPGDGARRGDCIALAERLGLGRRVAFPGQVSPIAPWLCAADAAVSSSRSEGLPFHIMEAMYCGLPVIASDVKGHRDLLRDGETGLLYPFGDERACAEKISLLLEQETLRRRIAAAAYKTVQSYAVEAVLPQVMARYESLLPVPAEQNADGRQYADTYDT